MIIESIFNVIAFMIIGIIGLFPSFPVIDMSGLDGIFQAISLIDSFVSVRVISLSFVTIFVFMNIQLIWGVIMWVIRKIPNIQ